MSAVRELADEYYRYRQETEPHRLLYFGQLDGLERWEDVSRGAIADRQVTLRKFGERATGLRDEAGPGDDVLADTVAFTARATAHGLSARTEQTMVNPAFGLHTMMFTFLGRYSLVTAEHGSAYLAKLRSLPALLGQIASEVESSADQGNVALRRHLIASADAIEGYLARRSPTRDPLCSQQPPADLPEARGEVWRAEVADTVDADVCPALGAYANRLRQVAELGRPDAAAGLCHLAGGEGLYGDLVWSSTTVDQSADEIHATGLDQIERLEDEYRQLAGPLVGTTDIDEIYARLRDNESMRYQSGADIVRDATAALRRAEEVAPRWFGAIPSSECLANEIPSGPLAFYSPPDLATGKPGRFFFNTGDPAAWSTYQLEAVTFHESIPGHHLQLARFHESNTLHPCQVHFGIMAYLEGWGLYAERLADEMGLYSSELSRVGMLAADSMRACRLIVDTGMHALGWSRQQAIDYFLAHSPLSRTLVEAEIDRYIGMPGQALSYMIGRLEIDDIRSHAEQRPDFDITRFHDQVLQHGMVPLDTLRRTILESA